MAGAPPASPAQPTDHPRRSLVRSSSRKRAVSVACPRSLWQLIASAEAVRLHHEQAQRLCRAISERPTSTASSTTTSETGMFATPPLLTNDPAKQLHEIAGNLPTSGSSCSATATAASLATAAARQTPSTATLDTAVAPSTTPTSSSDVLLAGDFVAVAGLPGASPVEPQYVPLPIDANLEDMDTTTTRKRSHPSELGSDDEGASRKLQAVWTAPHIASTTKLPPRVSGEDDRHFTPASGIITEGEFQQVLSKAQKRRERSALPPGLAGNSVPSPGTEPAVPPAARPTAPCSSPAPTAPPAVDPVATAGVPTTSVPTSPLTARTVLFRPAHNGAAFPRTSRLAIAQALSALPGVKEVRVNTKKNIVGADAASPEWTEHLLATSEIAGMPVTARLPADRTQSSGVVQGVHGNYTNEDLLAAVSSKVRVVAAKRQGTTLVLRFAAPYPPRKDLHLQHALRGPSLPASPSAVPTLRVLRARHSNLPETGTVPAVRWPTPDAIVLFEQGQMPALWRTTSSRLA
ncbi:hypothetical protein HPB49_012119 [Dermacentor silvarum]|uniref:Uncharacterized protein n=1 Tax=Dermacentor silvarum TaxID=543639 RepID=A0ACB8C3H2_DERSI|nr:hypothetical protein HPB49_012119 [Dermacentor silvarum]